MRTVRRISLALLMALAIAIPAAAQSDRVTIDAAVGPSFATLGTTFAASAGLDVKLNDRASIVGEFGVLPHAPFREAAEVAPAIGDADASRVNAYHWNGNLRLRLFEVGRIQPYLTGGIGSFTADTVVSDRFSGTTRFSEHRTATDFATNLGAGVGYRFNDWAGIGADYRTFFVHRDGTTPRVNRFTAGFKFSLQ
jgi:opacity protein-like surface antigen